MNFKYVAIAAVLAAGVSSTASSMMISDMDVGSTWHAQWAATLYGENVAATSALTLDSVSDNLWRFTIEFNNTSDSEAELVGWGFSTDPDVAENGFLLLSSPDTDGDPTSGPDWSTGAGPNGTDPYGTKLFVEDCAFAGSNCNGGGSKGFWGLGLFEFTLTFDELVTSFDMTDAFIRLQAVGLDNESSAKLLTTVPFEPSRSTIPPNPLPLPSSALLMLAGLLGLTYYSRKQRRG